MKRLSFIILLMVPFTTIIQTPSIYAHTSNSVSYSLIEVNGYNLDYELKLDLTELGHSMGNEMGKSQLFDSKTVQEYINSRIELYADSVKVEGSIEKSDVETIDEKQFAVINLKYELEDKPEKLVLDYNIFLDDSDPSHANYAMVVLDGKVKEGLLSYESRKLEIGEVSHAQNMAQFLLLGLEHIFTGFAHILFVIKWVIPGSSAAILAFGLIWFIERAF